MSEKKETPLSGKQKLFADFYLTDARFNGTRAAEMAEYAGSRAVLASVAYENLRKPQIKAYISERLEAMTMPANVVLTRLTEIAEGKITDVLDEDGNFDLKGAKRRQKDGLIKKLKVKRIIKQKKAEAPDSMREFLELDELEEIESSTEILHEEVEFELYSAHEALRDLGKHHKLFTDRVESDNKNENVNLSLDEYNKRAAERLKAAEDAAHKRNE